MRPLPVSRAHAAAVRRRFCLPRRFLLFPAVRSPHKNHMALQRALELMRSRGRPVSVVTTGAETDAWFHGPDLIGLGYVSDDTLRALYELSDGLVTPTLYEAGSFPVFEAMMVGRPVACSRIPPLVEQLERDGAVAELFDPNAPADIAAALQRLRGMGPLRRARVVRHNRTAVGRRSWADVADGYMRVFEQALDTRTAAPALAAGES
jgi:glycosyltransferase involved in cell wall biosynthesis